MSSPKYQIGDRVQVIVDGVVKIPDTYITQTRLFKVGEKVSKFGEEGYVVAKDFWAYMLNSDDGWSTENVVFPYPEDTLDPAYERMVNRLLCVNSLTNKNDTSAVCCCL